jgi:hypothetical protein
MVDPPSLRFGATRGTDSGFWSSAVVETSAFAEATADKMADKSGHQPGAGHWNFRLAMANYGFAGCSLT